MVLVRGRDGLRGRLPDLQRHHGQGHPAARDAKRRLLVLQGDRHVLPAGAVDRHAGRARRPARAVDGAARERRVPPGLEHEQHVDERAGGARALLAARLQRRRRPLARHRQRCCRLQRRSFRVVPEAGRRDRGRDREDRRPAKPRRLLAGRARLSWPRDDAKLEPVRALMGEQDLDALVVRAPDNVLYLTNFWGMKGFDAAVFPREGEPTLITIEPSAQDAAETAWTHDVRLVPGYDATDPRPPAARALETACEAARQFGRVGLELSLGTQATDRMVGEPTTYTKAWFDSFPSAADATPLLNAARAIKTEQELE